MLLLMIMQMGISTPLLHCNSSYKYFDVADSYSHLKKIGEESQKHKYQEVHSFRLKKNVNVFHIVTKAILKLLTFLRINR